MTFANMSNLLRDLHSSPTLSLTLAGIFREGVEEEAVEISSENSGAGNNNNNIKSSDIEYCVEHISVDDEEEENNNESNKKKKKRKTYHRHTPEQIREMEALFKESPHPDEKQRLRLSKELGLHPRQVKFWFQNRRTQIKAVQERHENSLLKEEIDKLRLEIKSLRDIIVVNDNPSCPKCAFLITADKDDNEACNLRIENAKLKSEVEKLKSTIIGKNPSGGTSPNSSSYTSAKNEDHQGIINGRRKNSCVNYSCSFGSNNLEKSPRIAGAVGRAVDELVKMATLNEPLWVRSYESGREILNYDEYVKEFTFCDNISNNKQTNKKGCVEASRESATVFADLPWLVRTFMDANQWKELFPTLVWKVNTLDVVSEGEGVGEDGAIHLMVEEIQMLTPTVAAREIYFFRHCKQLSSNKWAIVDVSLDEIVGKIDESMLKCKKHPSGCIIEDTSHGHCKVTWVEHVECQKSAVHSLYRSIVNNGVAFGAKRWISSLQRQCERLVFVVATNVPTRDSTGYVSTIAGRKNTLKLAQRMTSGFCGALGYSSSSAWSKVSGRFGEDVRISRRKNFRDPSEPIGTIMCIASSVWLPVSHDVLFEFLRDENRRREWDITCGTGNTPRLLTNLAKGRDRGNAVTAMTTEEADEHELWILQDTTTTACESLVVYARVDPTGMQDVMAGCDSSNVPVLPSGFSIIPDGIGYGTSVIICSKTEEKNAGAEGGSLLTVAFQMLIGDSMTVNKPSEESVDSANALILSTLKSIKKCFDCEEE